MGKSSSSSIKKKRSKYSSQGRTKKRSKTKRTKSKKLKRRHDSVSYSEDESRSSLSVSSSSSEDDYKSRRYRSSTRKVVKASKKMDRARSSSSEDSPHVRKRKGSKKKDAYEGRKKRREKRRKKKIKRDASVSSTSSGPRSCSTCQSSGDSSDEREHEMRRGRSERREADRRKMGKIKSGTKRRRARSTSCSSYSIKDESGDYQSEERMISENTSKRLRSVIVLKREDEEEFDKDGHKEEMTYNHDDYPSSRSNDSNDGANNSNSPHQIPREDDKKECVACRTEASELSESDKVIHDSNRATTDKNGITERKNEISEVVGSMDSDELESILRQRALENLKKFRGGCQTTKTPNNKKVESDGFLRPSSVEKSEIDQIKVPTKDDSRVVLGDSTFSSSNGKKITDGEKVGVETVSVKNYTDRPFDGSGQAPIGGKEKVTVPVDSGNKRPRLVSSALKQALPNTSTTPAESPVSWDANQVKLGMGNGVYKNTAQAVHRGNSASSNTNDQESNNASLRQTLSNATTTPADTASQESSQAKSVMGTSNVDNAGQMTHSVTTPSGNSSDEKVKITSGPTLAEPSSVSSVDRDLDSKKLVDEGKDGSQLQQKTMSVMRNGEMVQVSYKVYIPKKTPALARRQLKR